MLPATITNAALIVGAIPPIVAVVTATHAVIAQKRDYDRAIHRLKQEDGMLTDFGRSFQVGAANAAAFQQDRLALQARLYQESIAAAQYQKTDEDYQREADWLRNAYSLIKTSEELSREAAEREVDSWLEEWGYR